MRKLPLRVHLDADTANEIDDFYAIVRALLDPGFTIAGLSSAQWNHRLSPPGTVWHSQKANEDILELMDRRDIPVPLGAEMIVGKPWGGDEPRDSPAAQLIIREARTTPAGEKLVFAGLGAATNLASAIKLAPEIAEKIACYILMARFDAARGVWDKDEFNVRNDLNGANFLLNCEPLEIHLMPINILSGFAFRLEEVMGRLAGRGGIWDYLAARWLTHAPDQPTRIMWDLALVIAMARPELAVEGRYPGPPENVGRELNVYTSINEEEMRRDWWDKVEKAQASEVGRQARR